MTLLKQSRKLSVFQRRQPPPHPLPSLQQLEGIFAPKKSPGYGCHFLTARRSNHGGR